MSMAFLLTFFLLVTPVSASYLFDDASSQSADSTSPPITAYPMTFACWSKPDATQVQAMFSLGNSGQGSGVVSLMHNDTVIGAMPDANGANSALSSAGLGTGTWRQGTAVFTDGNSRAAFLNGGSKGTNTNSTSGLSGTLDAWRMARHSRSGAQAYFSGHIAECAAWSVALSDANSLTLQKYAPNCVRPDALVTYYRAQNDGSGAGNIIDRWGDRTGLTRTNNPTQSDDNPLLIRCDE